MRHPTFRPPSSVARWRAGLAGMLVAGLAMIGAAVGVATPAAAEEEPGFDSTLEIEITDCAGHYGQGSLHYLVRDMYPYYQDFITITDAAAAVVYEATYLDGTQFEADVALDPGEYTIFYTVERETGGRNIDEQAFTIGACPDLDVNEPVMTCSTGAEGTATFVFTNLVEGEPYGYWVEGIGVSLFEAFTAEGPSQQALSEGLPPGNYYVYVEWQPEVEDPTVAAPPPMWDWRGFVVEPCQPVITVEVTECTAVGGTGSALVTLSNLVADVEFDVQVTDADGKLYGGAQTVTADVDGTAQLSVSKLPPGGDFTVSVAGLWTTPPWVEPEFVGAGGSFTPIESLELVAQADFIVKPCPVATTTKPALAATGVDGIAPLVTGALVLLGLGGALLLRRRRADSRDLI